MKSISAKLALVFAACLLFAASALASPADGALQSLMKARASLIALLDTSDAATQKTLQGEIVAASAAVDGSVKAALADKATPADQAKQYKEFSEVWKAFKTTRDSEIIPAIKAGKVDVAKSLAKGIQAERFGKMKELLAALGAK